MNRTVEQCLVVVTVALLLAALPASAAPTPPLSATEATAIRLGRDAREPWRPHAITLKPAKWIWLPAQRTLPNSFVLFRKEVDLPTVPTRADGWIAADSRYKLAVNGVRVQWGPAPCDPRNLDADPIDLKPYLKAGKNVIGVEVLFYGHGDGTWPGGRPGLILYLDIATPGTNQRVVTDQTWQALLDRAHRPGQYKRWFLRSLQEEFDARLYPYGWDTSAFCPDSRWVQAMEVACAPDKPPGCRADGHWSNDSVDRTAPEVSSLRMRQIPLTRETIITAKRLAHSGRVHWKRDPADWFDVRMNDSFQVDREPMAVVRGDDAWELPATPKPDQGVEATFEFTEQIAGFPRFRIEAPAGTIVELMVQESHDPQKTRWLDSYHFSWSRFICREGDNEFETFDYESFRWLQLHVRNASRPVVVRAVGVRRRQYDWPVEPVIRTSEAPLQRLFDAAINTLRNSALDSVVDGGGRERQQYSGDGGHQLHAIRYAFGERRIAARFLRTFSEGLTKTGFFLDCYPAYDRLARLPQRELDAAYWGPLLDHGVGFVFDNWNHYLETGDREALYEPYPRLKRFADYLWTLRGKDGLLPVEDLGIPNVWIDHQAYHNQRDRQCAFNLYTAAMYRHALTPLAEAMGDVARAAQSRQRGDDLLRATVMRFWSKQHRVFLDNLPWLVEDKTPHMSDRALATAILFDQCPGGDTAVALRALVETPREMGLSYPCNAGWRYWALARLGRADVVLRDFRMRWATMRSVIENNTLQEMWKVETDGGSQWSHCPLAPIFVLYQDIVGLRPLAPDFARLQLRPQLGDLPDLEVIAYTPRGPVEFRARREAGGHRVEVKLPPACEAELLLPADVHSPFPALGPSPLPGVRRYRLPSGGGVFQVPFARP
jgi:alpha-L-rhamnosidase